MAELNADSVRNKKTYNHLEAVMAQRHNRVTVNAKVVSSIPIRGKIFFNFYLLALITEQSVQNSVERGELSFLKGNGLS